jgi:hypothetical protein
VLSSASSGVSMALPSISSEEVLPAPEMIVGGSMVGIGIPSEEVLSTPKTTQGPAPPPPIPPPPNVRPFGGAGGYGFGRYTDEYVPPKRTFEEWWAKRVPKEEPKVDVEVLEAIVENPAPSPIVEKPATETNITNNFSSTTNNSTTIHNHAPDPVNQLRWFLLGLVVAAGGAAVVVMLMRGRSKKRKPRKRRR